MVMALGYDREIRITNLTDTAELSVKLYDGEGQPVSADDLSGVIFKIQRPDFDEPTDMIEVEGELQDDGTGYLQYQDTDIPGEYKAIAQFTVDDGNFRSVRCDFQVIDPFDPPAPTDIEIVSSATWARLNDCFDADEGGPWLRDETMTRFDETKIPTFINDALFDLNHMNPQTSAALGMFMASGDGGVTRPDLPVIVQGTLVMVIRHLMRAYVEQPLPQGGQIVYEDRRDYLQRWGTLLQLEKETYFHWAALWKRQFLGLGHTKMLVSSKAGRLLPAPMRTRNIGRGFY